MRIGKNGSLGRSALLSFALSIFIMGALFGAMLDITMEAPERPPEEAELPEETPGRDISAGMERTITVLDTTAVEWFGRFSSCGHEYALHPAGELLGMTRDEAEAAFAGYDIELFTSTRVRMIRASDGLCPAHYVLKEHEGALCVLRTDPETLENSVMMRLPSDVESLPEEYKSALTEGLVFDSLVEINEYLEGSEG